MKMISLIGNDFSRRRGGFTFVEVMVTISVLAVGITSIYKGMLVSLDVQRHLVNRAYAMNLANDKLENFQKNCADQGRLALIRREEVERVKLNNQALTFRTKVNIREYIGINNLLGVDLSVSWKERGREFSILRSAYLLL